MLLSERLFNPLSYLHTAKPLISTAINVSSLFASPSVCLFVCLPVCLHVSFYLALLSNFRKNQTESYLFLPSFFLQQFSHKETTTQNYSAEKILQLVKRSSSFSQKELRQGCCALSTNHFLRPYIRPSVITVGSLSTFLSFKKINK